jgi:hypothetical protein
MLWVELWVGRKMTKNVAFLKPLAELPGDR